MQHRPSWCTPWWAGRRSRGPWGTAGHAGRRPGWCSGSWSMGAPGNTGRHRKVLSCVNLALYSQNALTCGCLSACVRACVCVCVRALRIVSTEKILRFRNTLTFIYYYFKKSLISSFPRQLTYLWDSNTVPALASLLHPCHRLRWESDYWVQSEQVRARVSTQHSCAEKFALIPIVTGLRV